MEWRQSGVGSRQSGKEIRELAAGIFSAGRDLSTLAPGSFAMKTVLSRPGVPLARRSLASQLAWAMALEDGRSPALFRVAVLQERQ
ncbi:hypothetical protein BSQ44_03115 [Aquibium oceanicum]|uniref:Uncharacterized protein n=1 Tax=Aquibium oceanicum TaxID=1670800 RepID=A0A1L3SMC0_9HYPH|nr:hypothetical protein BSQ44_03115 [Aquibium oceanicum]